MDLTEQSPAIESATDRTAGRLVERDGWAKTAWTGAAAAALGMAILLMEENDAVSDRIWGN